MVNFAIYILQHKRFSSKTFLRRRRKRKDATMMSKCCYRKLYSKHNRSVYTFEPTKLLPDKSKLHQQVYHFKTNDDFPSSDEDEGLLGQNKDCENENEEYFEYSDDGDSVMPNSYQLKKGVGLKGLRQPFFKCDQFPIRNGLSSKSWKYYSACDCVKLVKGAEQKEVEVSCNPFRNPIISPENVKKFHIYFRNVVYTCCGRKCLTCAGK